MRLLVLAVCLFGLSGLVLLLHPGDIHHNTAKIKINGVSLVNPPFRIDSAAMSSLKRINGDWVAVIPFAFSRNNEPGVHFNHDRQWWGERLDGTAELIRLAHQNNLKVMVKPHVWLRGKWIGDFDLDTEEKWKTWEKEYLDYIMTFARLADSVGAEMLCVGTELKIAVVKRPQFWRDAIVQIRKAYNGKLTYAANWDNFQNITFWEELDYIGIDGYFPLSSDSNPNLSALESSWEPVKKDMMRLNEETGKPILFTEYGYQSLNGAAGNHWEVTQSKENVNLEIQALAYECLFKCLWQEEWFAGGFLWKWHFREGVGGPEDYNFTPQGKPAEVVISRWYGKELPGID